MNMRARALDLVKLGVIGLALKAVSLYLRLTGSIFQRFFRGNSLDRFFRRIIRQCCVSLGSIK